MSFIQLILQIFCRSSPPKAERNEQEVAPPHVGKVDQQQPTARPPPSRPLQPPAPQELPPVHLIPTADRRDGKSPAPPHRPQHHADLNQINQQDEHYCSLRAGAKTEGDQMAQAFERSKGAYASGDGALAKQLSNEGKEHQRKMESLNKQASEWIFHANNKDSQLGEVDLHGLFVKEAVAYTDSAIQTAKQRGDSELHLIVGRGLHSQGGVAKIKPAIEDLMKREQIIAELDPNNEGVLIVHLDGAHGEDSDSIIGPGEITDRLERDKGCIIM